MVNYKGTSFFSFFAYYTKRFFGDHYHNSWNSVSFIFFVSTFAVNRVPYCALSSIFSCIVFSYNLKPLAQFLQLTCIPSSVIHDFLAGVKRARYTISVFILQKLEMEVVLLYDCSYTQMYMLSETSSRTKISTGRAY